MSLMVIEQIGSISILRFAPSELVVHGVASATKAGGYIPSTASEALAQDSTLFAVLDGPMFEKCSAGSYSSYTCGDPRFLLRDSIGNSINENSDESSVGGTIFVKEGVAHYIRGGVVPAEIEIAVQGYPTLVVDGVNTAGTSGTNQDRVWRAALCIIRSSNGNEELAFAVGHDTMYGFAASLIGAGAVYAVYTDGGGSGRLATRDGFVGDSENRRVPLWLGVRPSSGFSTVDVWPIVGVTAIVVVAGALGYVAYKELAKSR